MSELRGAARVLGVDKPSYKTRSDVQYLALFQKGLPLKSLNVISRIVAPADTNFKYRIIPKATIARRKKGRALSTEESVVIGRIASIWDAALKVWHSDEEARAFLFRTHSLLENRRPIDLVLANELGAQLVRNVIGRLESGSAV
jgi:putative toxin-antitoxin system antitoxin component (TIGR02293 family)